MVVGGKLKVKTGISLAIFYVLIFPGNINQYVNEIDAFSLNTDTSRFIRLLFQPILVLLALFSSGGLSVFKKQKTNKLNHNYNILSKFRYLVFHKLQIVNHKSN